MKRKEKPRHLRMKEEKRIAKELEHERKKIKKERAKDKKDT